MSAAEGSLEMVKLISPKLTESCPSSFGEALARAARKGHVNVVEDLLPKVLELDDQPESTLCDKFFTFCDGKQR